MHLTQLARRFAAFSLAWAFIGCGSDKPQATNAGTACNPASEEGCGNGQVCEETTGSVPACFEPIEIQGHVTSLLDGTAVEGAIVVARDANGAAVSGTATTDASGSYMLTVPVKRDANGNPVGDVSYTLRADADGYQTFPTSPRIALPINMSQPDAGVVRTAATDIGLIPLPSTTGLGTITGKVTVSAPAGTLVVAGSSTALVGTDGNFTIFNVPAGTVTVSAYLQGTNIDAASVSVTADATTKDVVLTGNSVPAVTVSGKVDIVNPGNGKATSVILVVADTFVANAAQGQAPPGLRVANVAGNFSITGVPNGKYVVLAAFENDYLVRDPDTCIGGTDIVTVTVSGSDVALADSFKITGALDVVSPDAEQVVSGTPTFVWADDSSEDHYVLSVYDALGTLVWENANVPGVSGSSTVSAAYAGPALTPGMIYQYRATSIRKGDCPISKTEDLRGVFQAE